MRTEQEIDTQMNLAQDQVSNGGGSKWPGMTFEQGVALALAWALGHEETAPMEDEPDA